MPTRRTPHARASLRLRATPPATSVSRIDRSGIRSRVITGTLIVVKIFSWSPHRAPQATLRRNRRSAARAIRTRSSRVSSRNRSIRALRAAARASRDVPPASSTSGRAPTTRISSPSAETSGGPANQSLGNLDSNQPRVSWIIDYNITSPRRPGRRSRGDFLALGAEELEAVDDDLRLVALLPGRGVVPRAGSELTLDEQELALVQVGACPLRGLAEENEVVKVGPLLGGPVVRLACVDVGRDPHGGDVNTAL